MLTVLLVIAAAAWVGVGNHALHVDFKRERQANPGWRPGQRSFCGEETCGWLASSIMSSLAGPLTYLMIREDIAKRLQFFHQQESLPGQLEVEKRLLDDLGGVRRCLAIQAEKIAAAKALSDGTADPEQAHTAPLFASDLESACDLWRELKERESAIEDSLAATREQIAWLQGMYDGIIEANGISEGELQEAVKQLPAPAEAAPPVAEVPVLAASDHQLPAPPDDIDSVMLAKLGDPGPDVHRKVLAKNEKASFDFKGKTFSQPKIRSLMQLAMSVLPRLSPDDFKLNIGFFGGWISENFSDHQLGLAVGNASSAQEAKEFIECRLKQAIVAVERSQPSSTAAPAPLSSARRRRRRRR